MTRKYTASLLLTLSALCSLASGLTPTTAQSPLPTEVLMSSPQVAKIGRFVAKGDSTRCQWGASYVGIAFEGSDAQLRLTDEGGNFFEVEVDGKSVGSFKPVSKKSSVIDLVRDLAPGRHVLRVMKRTEAFCGPVTFEAFLLNQGAKVLEMPAARHRIEVIGDSISCGYGNEGKSEKEHYAPPTQNAYLTYGAITARTFDADFVCIAWSGKKMWPNNMLPDLYDRAFPMDAASKWDFSTWKPEVVLINLATNDFGKSVPEHDGWVKAYTDFVKRVRGNYPDATIYLALGSMMYGKNLAIARDYVHQVQKTLNDAGDAKVKYVEFPTQNAQQDGLGSDWHPSLKTHQKMADKFIAAIREDLKW